MCLCEASLSIASFPFIPHSTFVRLIYVLGGHSSKALFGLGRDRFLSKVEVEDTSSKLQAWKCFDRLVSYKERQSVVRLECERRIRRERMNKERRGQLKKNSSIKILRASPSRLSRHVFLTVHASVNVSFSLSEEPMAVSSDFLKSAITSFLTPSTAASASTIFPAGTVLAKVR